MVAKAAKLFVPACAAFIGVFLILYLSLLGMQAYSARQASKVVDRLQALRLGQPAADFDKAVAPMRFEYGGHVLTAGAYRFPPLPKLMGKISEDESIAFHRFLCRIGLRHWRVAAFEKSEDGKLSSISVSLMVEGRYEMLGALWTLAPDIPQQYKQFALTEADRRTNMGWIHITSERSGEGFRVSATEQSTQKELGARKINTKCLLSFRGCDGLCELLPEAVPVLRDRNCGWGGYTGVPGSPCGGLP